MSTTGREKALWTIAIIVVVVYALIPVVWIVSLSLKSRRPIADRKFLPAERSRSRTTRASSPRRDFTARCATRSASR